MTQFENVFDKKKVLITGNSGFKGSWLTIWLKSLGADIYGISKGIPTSPSNFDASHLKEKIHYYKEDVRNYSGILKVFEEVKPDFVFHLAAQPLVRESYRDPRTTLETNIMGTTNILESLRVLNIPCTCVIITSDKCYENIEMIWGYRENDALGGDDPYSASKGGAELVVKTYAKSFYQSNSNVKVATARAGNVIGGGDWAVNRIVPDAIKSWVNDDYLTIRNPKATRPWQHVLEPLSGYLLLAKNLFQKPELNGEPFNFGPNSSQNHSVERLLQEMSKYWENAKWKIENDTENMKEAGLLKLNCDKSLHVLGWIPNLNFEETVEMVTGWYHAFYREKGINLFDFTLGQINKYVESAKRRDLIWVK